MGTRVRKVGILDLLSGIVPWRYGDRIYHSLYRRQFYGVMPQAVAAWCRRQGHQVFYATYYGQQEPHTLLPSDLDYLIISAFSEAASLAYAVSKIYRGYGCRTVLGGPHARSFPVDAVRFFDIVVTYCDESVIKDIIDGHCSDNQVMTSGNRALQIPPLAERRHDLDVAMSSDTWLGRRSIISLIASTGCPYSCDFCVDWNNPYRPRNADDVREDLAYSAKVWPHRTLAFYDPNFGINFDGVMGILESLPQEHRNPYIIESSLSILKFSRLARLRRTNCIFLAPGIESWTDYGQKAGTGGAVLSEKFTKVVAHFDEISKFVPGLQANFMFGNDSDRGEDPVQLTKAFIAMRPNIMPGLGYPIAYGATPLREQVRRQGRLLPLPPMYYFNPLPSFIPKHYSMIDFYDKLLDIHRAAIAPATVLRRMRAPVSPAIHAANLIRAAEIRRYSTLLNQFNAMLRSDHALLSFTEGNRGSLPAYLEWLLDQRLGAHYAPLIPTAVRQVMVEE
jgi:hypothetical protein